jgi:hypothetical protein
MTTTKRNVSLIDSQRLLTGDQAAVLCGMSPNHFREHVAPLLVSRKFGRLVMYDRRQINETLDRLYGLTQQKSGESAALQLLESQ